MNNYSANRKMTMQLSTILKKIKGKVHRMTLLMTIRLKWSWIKLERLLRLTEDRKTKENRKINCKLIKLPVKMMLKIEGINRFVKGCS
jgi:hypothetical protein